MVLKASHAFNLLDARGAISVTERQRFILRVRTLARKVAISYTEARANWAFLWQMMPIRQKRWRSGCQKNQKLSYDTVNIVNTVNPSCIPE